MKKSYIITKDLKSPVVVNSQTAHKPAQIRFKNFRKGQIVSGELKHAGNQPAFVLVGRMCVVPLECVKELQGKDIQTSGFTGADMDKPKTPTTKAMKIENPRIKYLDAIIIGGLAGFLAVHLGQKHGYITPHEESDKKYKMYGAIGGAVVGLYLTYRHQSTQKVITQTTPKQ
jgi:hypothetical protein